MHDGRPCQVCNAPDSRRRWWMTHGGVSLGARMLKDGIMHDVEYDSSHRDDPLASILQYLTAGIV
jgi:hypothetical protein